MENITHQHTKQPNEINTMLVAGRAHTNLPKRIQRKRVKGWKNPPNTVYVGRPTKWGNPFVVGQFLEHGRMIHTRKEAVELFERYHANILTDIESLRGKNLSCFCPIGEPCHADILIRLANG